MTRSYLIRAAVALFAVLALFELTVRIFALSRGRNVTGHPDLGWVAAGGTEVRWGAEGWGRTRFIGDGEIATPFRDGPAVIVLGDSHTEAFQVDDQWKFVSAAEALLRARGHRVDLRNFGRSGASMADYVWLVRYFRGYLRPSAFVIQVDEFDFDEHAFDTAEQNYFVRKADGGLEVKHNGPTSPSRVSSGRTVFQLSGHLRERLQALSGLRKGKPQQAAPADTRATVALEMALLREAAAGTPLILLRLPYSPYSEETELERETFAAVRAAQAGIYIDPSAAFRESRKRGRDPRTFFNEWPSGGHLNVHGHAIVSQYLAAGIEKVLP